LSSRALNVFKVGDETMLSGKLFHNGIILLEKLRRMTTPVSCNTDFPHYIPCKHTLSVPNKSLLFAKKCITSIALHRITLFVYVSCPDPEITSISHKRTSKYLIEFKYSTSSSKSGGIM